MSQQDRAVTPVVSTILIVVISIILAATVSAFTLGVTEDLNEPAPNVADTTGEFNPGASNQIVRLTHIAGDSIKVENIEIIVRASGPGVNEEVRLVNLPGDGFFSGSLEDSNIDGNDNLISQSFESTEIIVVDDTNVWSSGRTIKFEINANNGPGSADFRENPIGPDADKLEVVIVHKPSNSILSEHTFRP